MKPGRKRMCNKIKESTVKCENHIKESMNWQHVKIKWGTQLFCCYKLQGCDGTRYCSPRLNPQAAGVGYVFQAVQEDPHFCSSSRPWINVLIISICHGRLCCTLNSNFCAEEACSLALPSLKLFLLAVQLDHLSPGMKTWSQTLVSPGRDLEHNGMSCGGSF